MRRPSQSIRTEREQSDKKCQIGRSINIMTLFNIDNKISLVSIVWCVDEDEVSARVAGHRFYKNITLNFLAYYQDCS